ncbi:glycosyltransferase [Pseudoclavibacter helvolus]|uniref:glycosyltransferase n=1 Tax=Pseudoclavibacter helvolus TaxID=255205 RepID=UPI0024AC8E32|nr:glycosyltransferase [Pseudoclavibacter helvolus]
MPDVLPAERPLRIAFVVLHTSPLDEPGTKDAGGMNVVVLAQAEALAARGHQVELITRRSDPNSAPKVQLGDNLRLHNLAAGPARLIAKGEHEGVIDEFRDALAALLTTLPVDVLHAQHWFSGVAALPVARELGIPLVQSFHSIAADSSTPLADGERAESPGRLAGEAMLAKSVDAIVVVSRAERDTVLTRLGGDPAITHIVPPGVDADLFFPSWDARAEPAAREARPRRALSAGRLHPLKGFDLALDAIAEIDDDVRPDYVLVGAAPPDEDGRAYEAKLHEAVEQHGLADHVHYIGSLSRHALAAQLRLVDIVLIPSHSETYGLVALEAAASGVPVVASAAGGLREAVVDGVTGTLLESREPADWAATIAGILRDPVLAERMSVTAREHALAHSWDLSAEGLLAVFRELVAKAEPGSAHA